MKNVTIISSIILGAFLLNACASQSPKQASISTLLAEETGQNGRSCVRQSDIRGYGSLKEGVISLDGSRHYYLLTTRPRCLELETSPAALFDGKFGEICGGGMDAVVSRDGSCTVHMIFEFENRKEAFAVYDKVREQQQAQKNAESSKDK